MHLILWPIVSWLLREVIVKFVIMGVLFLLVSVLAPMILGFLGDFVSPQGLNAVFANVPPGAWYFIDYLRLDYGLPLLISAVIARFLIRRIPFMG